MPSDRATSEDLDKAPAPRRADGETSAGDQLNHDGIPVDGANLVRASQLTGRPVVTLEGDHDLEVKDVVFDKTAGGITGFTLRKPGLLGGPQRRVLTIADVTAIGPDAVMIPNPSVFTESDALAGSGDNVLGDQVITDDGTLLGTVVDVIAAVRNGEADIVAFEVDTTEAVTTKGVNAFVPLPATTAISDEAIVVPAAAKNYMSTDYAGVSGAVAAFRQELDRK